MEIGRSCLNRSSHGFPLSPKPGRLRDESHRPENQFKDTVSGRSLEVLPGARVSPPSFVPVTMRLTVPRVNISQSLFRDLSQKRIETPECAAQTLFDDLVSGLPDMSRVSLDQVLRRPESVDEKTIIALLKKLSWNDVLEKLVYCNDLDPKNTIAQREIEKRQSLMTKFLEVRWKLKITSIVQSASRSAKRSIEIFTGSPPSTSHLSPVQQSQLLRSADPDDEPTVGEDILEEEPDLHPEQSDPEIDRELHSPGEEPPSSARLRHIRHIQSVPNFKQYETIRIVIDRNIELVIGTPGSTSLSSDLDQTIKMTSVAGSDPIETFKNSIKSLDLIRGIMVEEARRYVDVFGRTSFVTMDSNTYLPGELNSLLSGLERDSSLFQEFQKANSYYLLVKKLIRQTSGTMNNRSIEWFESRIRQIWTNPQSPEAVRYLATVIKMEADEMAERSGEDTSLARHHLCMEKFDDFIQTILRLADQKPLPLQPLIFTFMTGLMLIRIYAEEGYTSEDAYQHVVEKMQQRKDVPLTAAQLVNSALNNLGYVVSHWIPQQERVTHSPLLRYCLEFKAQAKYAGRIADALQTIPHIVLTPLERELLDFNRDLLAQTKEAHAHTPQLWKNDVLENMRARYVRYFPGNRVPNGVELLKRVQVFEKGLWGSILQKLQQMMI